MARNLPYQEISLSVKTRSLVGAPSQHKQSSRKGKKAWRKNVNLEDVETGLEDIRKEERVLGTALQKQKDHDLFQIDTKGDENTRKALPRASKLMLTSTKIIAQRSAVPAVYSRPTSTSTSTKRKTISREDKERLLRTAKRLRRGPLNSYVDPTDFGAGSAAIEVSEAVKNSGQYDPWAETSSTQGDGGLSRVKKAKAKSAAMAHPRDLIELPAVAEPHEGLSYNPPVASHQELLLKAHEVEEQREVKEKKLEAMRHKVESSWQLAAATVHHTMDGVAPGMTLDDLEVEEEQEEVDQSNISVPTKMPKRKTKQQRQKAAKLLAERRALAARTAKKRLLATINNVKSIRSVTAAAISAREQARMQRLLENREQLKKGLAGRKLGTHVVPEGEIDVQLGEDLSESLRQLKPEGNLFRDRFLSMQQRALVEPRVRVLPKKRKNKIIEYEKHAWKRFE